jgi:hypothetical protein
VRLGRGFSPLLHTAGDVVRLREAFGGVRGVCALNAKLVSLLFFENSTIAGTQHWQGSMPCVCERSVL